MIALAAIPLLALAVTLVLYLRDRHIFTDSRSYIRESDDWLGPIHWDWPR